MKTKAKKLRGSDAMRANGYKAVTVWLGPRELEVVEKACKQAGYARASLLRAGALKLAGVICGEQPAAKKPLPRGSARKGGKHGR